MAFLIERDPRVVWSLNAFKKSKQDKKELSGETMNSYLLNDEHNYEPSRANKEEIMNFML